jgi:hypothetical protein
MNTEQPKPTSIKFNGTERNGLKKGQWYKVVFFNKFNGCFTIRSTDGNRNVECKSYEAEEAKYDNE